MKRLILSALLFVSLNAQDKTIDQKKFSLGEKIYKETCISCHGLDGKSKTDLKLVVRPRDLTKTLLNEKQIYLITKDGAHHWGAKSDIMPAFKYVYSKKELESVAYYISKKFNPNLENQINALLSSSESFMIKDSQKADKWGKKIYFRNCVYCHGVDGKGDGEATKNPEDSIYPYNLSKTLLTNEQMFLYVKFGGQHFGTFKNDMPSWKIKYNDFKLHSVVKYIDEVIRDKDNK